MDGDASPDNRHASGEDGAIEPWPRWPRWLIVAYLTFFVSIVSLAVYLNMAADARVETGLAFLGPLVDLLTEHVRSLQEYYVPTSYIFPACAILLALYAMFAWVPWLQRAGRSRWQLASRTKWLLVLEVTILVLVTLTTVVFRFYALNRQPRDFIGELVFMIVATSDLPTLFAVSGGAAPNAPWAPLGLLYFLLMGALWRISGSTVLTMCLAAAIPSVVLAQLLYWFTRHLAGPLAALLALALYTVTPVEMAWGRHSMQPFNYPSIPVVLLAATTYFAITRFRLRYWIASVALMGVAPHSFGSGYSAFLIPIAAVGWLLLFDRQRLRQCGWKPLTLVVGVVLWVLGPSLAFSLGAGWFRWMSPFDPRLSSRAFRGAGWEGSLEGVKVNLDYIFHRLYIGTTGDVHQTPIAIFGSTPGTYVSPLVTILLTVGLIWLLVRRRRPFSAVLFPSVFITLVPGLISYANAHREAPFFPMICIVAACTAAAGLRRFQGRFPTVGTVAKVALPLLILPPMFARVGAIYFARPMGEPPSVTIARAIKKQITPGTVLVLDLPYALAIDVTYLLFDASLVEPFTWDVVEEKDWPRVVDDPMPRYQYILHRHTALKHRIPALRQMKWRRAVYIIHNTLDPARKVALLKERYPSAVVKEVHPPTWNPPGRDDFTAVIVPLEETGKESQSPGSQ